MIAECTRCGKERRVMPIYMARPGGHSFLPPPDFEPILPPEIQRTCGDCITDEEIMRELSPVVEFVLGVLLRSESSNKYPQIAIALETARAFFMVRNNDPDGDRARHAAVRALGLGDDV